MNELAERIAAKVIVTEGGCWEWNGSRDENDYGRIKVGGKNRRAHRVSYETHVGPIPQGLTTDHLCRNHPCVNPAHLEAVTRRTNTLRGTGPTAVNAAKTVCIHGHALTADNVYLWRGQRHCRTCRRDRRLVP